MSLRSQKVAGVRIKQANINMRFSLGKHNCLYYAGVRKAEFHCTSPVLISLWASNQAVREKEKIMGHQQEVFVLELNQIPPAST